MAANQAAARETPSLPYLKQVAPTALRFAMARVRTPAPPPLGDGASAAVRAPAESGPTTEAGAADGAGAPAASASGPASLLETGAMPAEGVATPDGATANSPNGAAQGGVRLLPDRYAPPVRVEDLLPFFLPAEPARSRAEYELK